MFEFAKARPGRRREFFVVVDKGAIFIETELKSAKPVSIINPEEKVGFEKRSSGSLFFASPEGFSALEKETPPTIGSRIEEDSEVRAFRVGNEVAALKEAKRGI
jgi:hypothetical protein